jgi:3-hydroxy-9,10-secoandrosta-1,3,5(10)-triene-9,17-dione monooxygenase
MGTTTPEGPISFEPATSFDRAEFLARAEAIGRVGEADSLEADRNSRATDRLIQTIKNAQIADLWKPRRYGGLGADLKSYGDMIRTISRYDMAAGWLAYFYSIHEVWVGYMQPEGREEVFGDGGLVADVLAPVGRVEPDGDDYRLSGQWNFASGVPHSDWIGLGAVTQLPDGEEPEYCLFVVPVSECEIVENWDTLGMRGTGSHGVSLERALVPAHRVLAAGRVLTKGAPMGGDYDPDEPIYRMPFLPFFTGFFPAVALGGAERIVNEFQQRTESRTRVFLGGVSAKSTDSSPRVLAELRMRLYEMEGLVDRYRQQLQSWLEQGTVVNTAEEKAQMFALRGEIAHGGVDVAVKATQMLGGTALFKGDPVEMFTRDLLNLGSHGSHLYEDAMTTYGGAIFGGPAHPVW